MKKENELCLAFSLGSIIDTKKAEAVFEEKGLQAFHEVLKKQKTNKNIFSPGPALGLFMALRRLNREIPDDILKIKFVLVSPIDPNPKTHAVITDSINHYLLENKEPEDIQFGFDLIAFTGSKDVTPFLKMPELSVDLMFTTSELSAKKHFLNGIPSVCIPNIDYKTNIELYNKRFGNLIFFMDYDGVIGDAESEKVYQNAIKEKNNDPIKEFLIYEEKNKKVPMQLGPMGKTIKKLSRVVDYQKKLQMKTEDAKKNILEIIVVTARSGQANERFWLTIDQNDIEISALYMMQGLNKNNILKTLGEEYKGNNLMFFDDSFIHFSRSKELKNITSFWVVNDENTKK